MKYACLVYLAPDKLHAVPDRECADCGEGLRQRGGKTVVTDGPFAETKELLAGFI